MAGVVASAADLAHTVADALGERPGPSVLPEFTDNLSGSVNNNDGSNKPACSDDATQVLIAQFFSESYGGRKGDFAENVFSARPKSKSELCTLRKQSYRRR